MAASRFEGFLQRLARSTGIRSQVELAEFLRLNRSAVSRAKQRDMIPEAWVHRLSESFGVDPGWLRDGPESMELYQSVPLAEARLDAGGGSYMVDAGTRGQFAFRKDWLRRKGDPGRMVLMQVIGDSMEPLIREGDTVLIDQSQREVYAGGVYAVGVQDTIMVKRVEKHPGRLALLSANPNYAPLYLSGDELETVRIIGRVVGMWRDFR
jgi:phage repressor protein C with HTH and peptisase S24 domain